MQRPGLHYLVPWSEAPGSEFEQLQLQGWLFQLQHGHQLLSLNLAHLSSLPAQVETRYQALLLKLHAQKTHCLDNIQEMKRKFEDMLKQCHEETSSHRFEPAYAPQGSLTRLLWKHMPSTARRLFQFSSQLDLISFPVSLKTEVTELQQYEFGLNSSEESEEKIVKRRKRTALMASVNAGTLRLFDCRNLSWRQVTIPECYIDEYAASMLLDNETVIHCGGFVKGKQAMQVSSSGVEQLECMAATRVLPALALLYPYVYAFGGGLNPSVFTAQRTCERYSLVDGHWSAIQPMSARRFNASACVRRLCRSSGAL